MKINNLKRTCWVNKLNSYFTGVPNHKEKTFLSSTKRALILKLTWPNLEFFFSYYIYILVRESCVSDEAPVYGRIPIGIERTILRGGKA